MKIEFTKQAKEDLDSLPKNIAERILKKLSFYATQKDSLAFAKTLKGNYGEYRFRIGKYRVVFDRIKNTIYILKIGKRDEIY